MKKLLSILILGVSLNLAYAQDNTKLSSAGQELLEFVNDPQNKNDSLLDPKNQNDTELVMFILKAIEDKKIKEKTKQIEFANSFQVSDDIKKGVINSINQNLAYSDNEKVSYGIYLLNKM